MSVYSRSDLSPAEYNSLSDLIPGYDIKSRGNLEFLGYLNLQVLLAQSGREAFNLALDQKSLAKQYLNNWEEDLTALDKNSELFEKSVTKSRLLEEALKNAPSDRPLLPFFRDKDITWRMNLAPQSRVVLILSSDERFLPEVRNRAVSGAIARLVDSDWSILVRTSIPVCSSKNYDPYLLSVRLDMPNLILEHEFDELRFNSSYLHFWASFYSEAAPYLENAILSPLLDPH